MIEKKIADEVQRIIEEDKYYENVLAKYSILQEEIADKELELMNTQLHYDTLFIERCNSEEYLTKYKTIKQREQEATLTLTQEREAIQYTKYALTKMKGQLRVYEWQLRFLHKMEED